MTLSFKSTLALNTFKIVAFRRKMETPLFEEIDP